MAKKREVSINLVLDEINQGPAGAKPHEFSIAFIRKKNDERRGSCCRVERAIKRGKDSRKKAEPKAQRTAPRLKESNLLLLYNKETRKPFYCDISTIIEYNGNKVRH